MEGDGKKSIRLLLEPARSLLLIGIVVLCCVPLIIQSATWLQVMILVLWYACLTLSWNFVGGFAGVLPLGHAAFAGIGAYTSTILFINWGITPWLGMLVGGAFAVAVALLIGYPTFRLHGAYYALASIAFVEVVRMVTENTNSIFGIEVRGARGLLLPLKGHSPLYFQFANKTHYYYIALAMMFLIFFVSYKIQRSKLGFYLVAGGEDQEAAESIGINVPKYKLIALAISAFFTALAGTFYAQLVLFIFPQGIMSLNLSFEIAFIAIIGGRGTLLGPILGSFVLVPLSEACRIYLSGSRFLGIHLMLYSVVIILAMIFQPRGLMGLLEKVYLRWRKTSAQSSTHSEKGETHELA